MVLFFDDILSGFGFFSATIYTLVPGIFLYQLKSNVLIKERLSIIGIFCLFINGLIYFIFSILNREEEELDIRDFCNLAGAYLGFIYVIIYFKYLFYEKEKKKFFIFLSITIFLTLIVILLEIILSSNETSIHVIEWIGVIFNILEYLPLGFNLIYLIKNKISEKYTLFGAFLGLINTIIWLIWAIYTSITKNEKNHSVIANICGLLLCLTQILIFFVFRKDEEESEEYKKVNDNSDNINNSTPEIKVNDNSTQEIKENNLQNSNINNKNNNLRGPSEIIEEFI